MPIASETYSLIDGTTAVIAPEFGIATTDTGPTNSAAGYANTFNFRFERDFFSMIVFADTDDWDRPLPRIRRGTLTMGGFQSEHGALSDPLALFSLNLPVPFLASVTPPSGSALTISGNCLQGVEEGSFVAMDASGRNQNFRTSGPCATSWVVS